jgi:hypothetical protein
MLKASGCGDSPDAAPPHKQMRAAGISDGRNSNAFPMGFIPIFQGGPGAQASDGSRSETLRLVEGGEAGSAAASTAEAGVTDFDIDVNGGSLSASPAPSDAVATLHIIPARARAPRRTSKQGPAAGQPRRPQLPTKSAKAVPTGEMGTFTSVFRGVTKHRLTGRFEAHFWDSQHKRQTVVSFALPVLVARYTTLNSIEQENTSHSAGQGWAHSGPAGLPGRL